MASQTVILIDVGKPEWRRWMIFHSEKSRYWDKGRWTKRRRQGELWHRKAEAEKELQLVLGKNNHERPSQ
jgi:hypothetical protein